MSYEGVVVRVGQIWYHRSCPNRKYHICEIYPRINNPTLYDGDAKLYVDNVFAYTAKFCTLNTDFSPYHWDDNWMCDDLGKQKPIKIFTRLSHKTLQKRFRDQMAGNILVGKL